MVWKVLFLISFLGVSDKAWGARNRKRELRTRDAVIYAFPIKFKQVLVGNEDLSQTRYGNAQLHSTISEGDRSATSPPDNNNWVHIYLYVHEENHISEIKKVQRCPHPCTCPATGEECSECGECPRQVGEPCSDDRPCDVQKGLVCSYKHGDPEGICKEPTGVPCVVYNNTYVHGETFNLDCRTQCACQNGTYGCSSLCPQEHISPRGSCQHPRLVELPGQCCREWMCDSQTAEHPPTCQPAFSRWSSCSRECGSGLSTRRSNLNPRCHPDTETRICQIRRCADPLQVDHHEKYHHLRRGHECKATHRLSSAVFLRFGPCRSRKRFRPKYCGVCPLPGISCQPTLSTTVKVEFFCDGSEPNENVSELLPEYLEPGADLWADNFLPDQDISEDSRLMTVLVQWVLKCQCTSEESAATSSTGEVILHRVHRTATP